MNQQTHRVTMSLSKRVLAEIVRRIRETSDPDRIILFGSAAAKQMTVDSDIDLLVLEPSVDDPSAAPVRIHQALRGLPYPFDIIVMPTDRFERTRDVMGGIAWPAPKYGEVLYERGKVHSPAGPLSRVTYLDSTDVSCVTHRHTTSATRATAFAHTSNTFAHVITFI